MGSGEADVRARTPAMAVGRDSAAPRWAWCIVPTHHLFDGTALHRSFAGRIINSLGSNLTI